MQKPYVADVPLDTINLPEPTAMPPGFEEDRRIFIYDEPAEEYLVCTSCDLQTVSDMLLWLEDEAYILVTSRDFERSIDNAAVLQATLARVPGFNYFEFNEMELVVEFTASVRITSLRWHDRNQRYAYARWFSGPAAIRDELSCFLGRHSKNFDWN